MGRQGILFFSYFQVKWLNKQLSKLWPYVADAATIIIRESVEPILEEYRPSGISSLKFSKLSLRNVAPKIEGILNNTSKLFNVIFSVYFECSSNLLM
ncbi:putative calcium-dependent lipid-binding transcriptional regulator, plant [Helianthus anomalus]